MGCLRLAIGTGLSYRRDGRVRPTSPCWGAHLPRGQGPRHTHTDSERARCHRRSIGGSMTAAPTGSTFAAFCLLPDGEGRWLDPEVEVGVIVRGSLSPDKAVARYCRRGSGQWRGAHFGCRGFSPARPAPPRPRWWGGG